MRTRKTEKMAAMTVEWSTSSTLQGTTSSKRWETNQMSEPKMLRILGQRKPDPVVPEVLPHRQCDFQGPNNLGDSNENTSNTTQTQHKHNTNTTQTQHKHNTITTQTQHNHNTNTNTNTLTHLHTHKHTHTLTHTNTSNTKQHKQHKPLEV